MPAHNHQNNENASEIYLRAFLKEPIELKPLQILPIPTGMYIEISNGDEVKIEIKTKLTDKCNINVLNHSLIINSDYKEEIKVLLFNLSEEKILINNGDIIAQMIIYHLVKVSPIIEISKNENI
jgi:dUTP pyrophosphatase